MLIEWQDILGLFSLQEIFSEFASGLAGGSLVGLFAVSAGWYKRKRIERKYPISGTYISYFEDIESDEHVVRRGSAKIKQKGTRIEIRDSVDDGRSWTLEGQIEGDKHIAGAYSANLRTDEGVGSFYLRIKHDLLDGFWSGYDNVNNIITSGRYWFIRMKRFSVRDFRRTDVNDILHISTDTFGYGYIDPNLLVIDDARYAVIATADDECVGFAVGHLVPQKKAADLTKSQENDLPDDVKFANSRGTLGVIKTIAVREDYKGHGIGSALFQASEERLKARGAECIIVPAWQHDGTTNLEGILQRHGYKLWKQQQEFWREDCEGGKFRCNKFESTCVCAVEFYRKGQL